MVTALEIYEFTIKVNELVKKAQKQEKGKIMNEKLIYKWSCFLLIVDILLTIIIMFMVLL